MLLDMEAEFTVVGQARDGVDAVSMAQQLQPDLVILDVSMPRLDGIEALPRVRAACAQARVVMFTGDSDWSMEGEAYEAGAAAVIPKEIGATTLVERLRALCAGSLSPELPAAG